MKELIGSLAEIRKVLESHNIAADRIQRNRDLVTAIQFINTASLVELEQLTISMIDRQSSLLGCAHGLEDSLCDIRMELKAERE